MQISVIAYANSRQKFVLLSEVVKILFHQFNKERNNADL